mmetsp:Transcript_23764/g.73159  ORF Transcript_23764/g.73159 Transcript_23764/m.73159 type:complete len:333 (-) Transcript_23764:255-1253(-)
MPLCGFWSMSSVNGSSARARRVCVASSSSDSSSTSKWTVAHARLRGASENVWLKTNFPESSCCVFGLRPGLLTCGGGPTTGCSSLVSSSSGCCCCWGRRRRCASDARTWQTTRTLVLSSMTTFAKVASTRVIVRSPRARSGSLREYETPSLGLKISWRHATLYWFLSRARSLSTPRSILRRNSRRCWFSFVSFSGLTVATSSRSGSTAPRCTAKSELRFATSAILLRSASRFCSMSSRGVPKRRCCRWRARRFDKAAASSSPSPSNSSATPGGASSSSSKTTILCRFTTWSFLRFFSYKSVGTPETQACVSTFTTRAICSSAKKINSRSRPE